MVNWTADKDQELLLCILAVSEIKLDYKKIAEAFGQGTTANSIQKRIKKIRDSCEASGKGNVGSPKGDGDAAAPRKKAVPRKRKAPTPPAEGGSDEDVGGNGKRTKVKHEEM